MSLSSSPLLRFSARNGGARADNGAFPNEAAGPSRVGEKLLQAGLVTRDQIQIALHEQRRAGGLLGSVLVRLGFLEGDKLAAVLAERTGFSSVDLSATLIDFALLRTLPKAVALRCRAIPVSLHDNALRIAMADPYDVAAMDEIRRHFPHGVELVPLVAPATDIAAALNQSGDALAALDGILTELESDGPESGNGLAAAEPESAWEHPVVRLVNTILDDAVRRGASDIHLEPESSFVRLRYRIDGALQQVRALHLSHWPELSHRIKIMAGLDIADRRSLQDGRFDRDASGATVDFRVAVMPTAAGENIVIRVLDHRRARLPLDRLGFNTRAMEELGLMLERPEGIVLVTGPTGCGKTTTLYSMLTKLSSIDVNVMTLEDPIEYRFDLIRQTNVQDDQGLSFAEGVRGILRQDPNIVFIGEIRDPDTAQMALRAAMTGHQVFSTLHCADALGALPRLIDLGLHPRMLAGHVTGVLAQRLVRALCPHCRGLRPATVEERRVMAHARGEELRRTAAIPVAPPRRTTAMPGFADCQSPFLAATADATDAIMVGHAAGCAACHGTGYKGRTAIAEAVRVTPELDELIAADAPRSALRRQIRADGFVGMAEDGIARALNGEIDLASLRRAVDLTRRA